MNGVRLPVDSPLVRCPFAVGSSALVSPCVGGSNPAPKPCHHRRFKLRRKSLGFSGFCPSAAFGVAHRQGTRDTTDRSSAQPGPSRSVQSRQPIITRSQTASDRDTDPQ
ncbi:hypothetical protein V6N13_108335 [Hibiscus sabdariffa]